MRNATAGVIVSVMVLSGTSTAHDDPSSRSTLEPPLWILRAGVTVEWRVRR